VSAVADVAVRGARVGRFTVVSTASEGRNRVVLLARDDDGSFVALKLATTELGHALVEHEEHVIRELAGRAGAAPRFVDAEGHSWCALSWTQGSQLRVAATELRTAGQRAKLLALCRRITRAYADLHAAGAMHGQVHPRHVLVDYDGRIGLVDFSVAALGRYAPPPVRVEARFNTLSAPEQAESLLRQERPALTPAAEQYSVAALLYLVCAGRMYARLRLERSELARDIRDSAPLAFDEPWPELEEVLARALSTEPAARFESMAAFASALDDLAHGAPTTVPPPAPAVPEPLARVLETFRRDAAAEDAFASLPAPTCSVNLGAAGIAFALTRLGKVTGEAADLEQAERWLSIAEQRQTDAFAFEDGDEMTPELLGHVTPFHTRSGLAAVRALLSEATGDQPRQQAALDGFRAATMAPCANLDITLGRSAVVLMAALLYAVSDPAWPATRRLATYGDELSDEIWREAEHTALPYFGIAHGWAGLAYASLMWSRARGAEPHPQARAVLDALATVAEPLERGCRWPLTPPHGHAPDDHWPGWCHGNAGYVFLWNLARDAYGDERFGELAARAAWLADAPVGASSLCCGNAGQAYAALNQYRSSGDERWRTQALRVAASAASNGELAGDATSPLSLYKGHAGLALLAVELEVPERASMPLFEFET
jgi:eukaryotic-like serine/threonine-protein kinase